MSFPRKFYNKIFREYGENDKFLGVLLRIYFEKFAHSFQSFKKCFSFSLLDSLLIGTNEVSIDGKCFKEGSRGAIRSNLAYFVRIWNISNIAWHKESLKFNFSLFANSDLIMSKENCFTKIVSSDGHKNKRWRHRKAIVTRCFVTIIAGGVPSVSSFLVLKYLKTQS